MAKKYLRTLSGHIDVIEPKHTVQILPHLRSSQALNWGVLKSNSSIAVATTVRVEEVDYTKQRDLQTIFLKHTRTL